MNPVPRCEITYLGTATVLLKVDGLSILTDPVFDAPGPTYRFGWGTSSVKSEVPAASPTALGPIDLVLLSHDQHADNLDDSGRKVIAGAGQVLTTVSAARRLGSPAVGLRTWQSTTVKTPQGTTIRITATPARHGPPLSRPFVGEVTGFVLEWPGQTQGALYISGDTVWFRGLRQVAQRFRVGTALLHLGSVQFPLYGPIRFTLNGKEAVRVAQALDAKTIIPVHHEGWAHFRQKRSEARAILAQLEPGCRVLWLDQGAATSLDL